MNRVERRRQQKLAEKAAKRKTHGKPDGVSHGQQLVPIEQQSMTIEQAVNRGVQHLSAGRLQQAETIYQTILDMAPDHPVALHLLGVIACQTGKFDIGTDLISKALAINPDYAEAHNNLGNALKDLGKLDKAMESYRNALAIKPEYANAHGNLGNVLKELGKLDKAAESYHNAIAIKPDYAELHSILGYTYEEMGKLDEAVESYRNALAIKPDYSEAHSNLGNAFLKLEKLDEAIESYQCALANNPNNAETHNNLGSALKLQGKHSEAMTCYRKALAIDPDFAEAHNNLGYALNDLGKFDEALESYHKALAIKPDYAQAFSNLGNTFQNIGRPDKAVESYQKVLAIKPDYAEGYSNLSVALKNLGKLDEAMEVCYNAITIKPDYAEAHSNLGSALQNLGRLDEAVESYRKALAIKPDYADAYSNLLLTEQYKLGVTLENLYDAHAEWNRTLCLPLQSEWQDHNNIPDFERRLRIGFVSPDLGRHPVGYFVISLLEHRREDEFEIFCYSDRKPDDLTERLIANSDEWTDARGMSDEALSQRIRSDQIDILFDLAGHTAKNRLLVFARKPAPIQITWAGYVGSTGLSAMDYLIADNRHVLEEAERYYTEEVIRLPDGYVSYEPPDYAPGVGPLPFEDHGFITFGCFNNPAKINETVLTAWAEILKALPGSQLILKYGNMDADGNRNRILDQFEAHGVDGSRLILEGKSPHSELLARYNDIDIALDTFPYSGGLTTCEALWMGVPVITKPEETFASRHSLSHLTNVGVPELAADDLRDYVAKSVELANDISRLTELRSELRERMANSALCDSEKFATDFTREMRQIWKIWCAEKLGEIG